MKEIRLNKGKVALVDDEDYKFLSQWDWLINGDGYAERQIGVTAKRKKVPMHRVINKTPDGLVTDHINRDKLDNRRANLRNATVGNNNQNRGPRAGSTSIYKGVTWHKRDKKWQAAINANYRVRFLGYYDSEGKAAEAYNVAAKKCFGDFAFINKIHGACDALP